MSSIWKTNTRSGRAHRVLDRKPECGAPSPQGGVTWGRTTRGHVRCPDCLALDAGATVAERDILRAHTEALAEDAHRELNS
jgi:hypothetical protein